MKIALFGATGRTGRIILKLARQEGHFVNALVRNSASLSSNDATVIIGDATNANAVMETVATSQAVISALGTDGGTVLTEALPKIITAMKKQGISRLITIGTAGILNSRLEEGKLRYESSESRRRLTRAAEEHRRVYELLAASDLDWTIVCPTYLPDGEMTKHYRVEKDYLPEDGREISTGDTAYFTYRQLFSEDYYKTRVGIAY
ncbi:NmrA family protein [Fictibacillus macauensis ZFHKF-1]|uniref:NmrA family protein n=1 Tax=Fictibacillus macauensis ZFHKF-1 TaxID=1196324 RepID=I8AEC9_9BACL|nr:SDR family oxidoreductase [Fictibacillus macauensis]EIT83674.1 NmrA family protein [Fictibacillus macauensis ZFHKF-1]